MKKILLLLLLPFSLHAQITDAIMKANFGIDADLRANFFNAVNDSACDDWFKINTGSGEAIIDSSGAAAILSGYNTNPASRNYSFARVMKQPTYSYLNNKLLIDAVFHRDFHGNDDSTVFSGGNKNGMSPVNWSCPVSSSVPSKNEILDAYLHVRRDGTGTSDSLWMFGALSIEGTTGNRYFDFELYQTDIRYNRATRTFINFGPDEGHTSWTFDATGKVISPGDIIFSVEYGGTSLSSIEARIWVKKTDLLLTPIRFNWGGQFDGASASSLYGYANIVPKSIGAFYTGIQNSGSIWAGAFAVVNSSNTVLSNYTASQFMEISVNLTKLGIDPNTFSTNPCGSPFRRVLPKTRASSSFSAELKDFIAPFSMFDYPVAKAHANIIYFCDSMPTIPLSVLNPSNASLYTWSTVNGNIVGSTNGPVISVNAPGTYYLNHYLLDGCPIFSRDSIRIYYDPACAVLDVKVTGFSGRSLGNSVSLQWKVFQNEQADFINVEYSTDGINFTNAGIIPASKKAGMDNYQFTHEGITLSENKYYYRIKLTGIANQTRYSTVIKISNESQLVSLYPNPSYGKTWLNITRKGNYAYYITDNSGRRLVTGNIYSTGNDQIPVKGISALPRGLYHITIRSDLGISTKKLIRL